jgi:hypothetical protein
LFWCGPALTIFGVNMSDEMATATEVLVKTMEDFSNSEARSIMVIYTNENDDVVCHSNVKRCEGLGMLKVAEQMILRQVDSDG